MTGETSASVDRRLNSSWSGLFRRKVYPLLLDCETSFADLYRRGNGRPNWSVARILGVAYLQEMHDYDDQEALDCLSFDIRWQYALDLAPAEAYLSRRSYVEFRSRLVAVDPEMKRLRAVFDRIAEAAIVDLGLSAQEQRIDSTRIVSNIFTRGRVELFRKTLAHFLEGLSSRWPGQMQRLGAELRTWWEAQDGGWFGCVKPSQVARLLAELAGWLQKVVSTFANDAAIAGDERYQLVARLLREHCEVVPVASAGTVAAEETPAAPTPLATAAEAGERETTAAPAAPAASAALCDEPVREATPAADAARSPESPDTVASTTLKVLDKPKEPSKALQSPFDPDAGCGYKGPGYLLHITETCRNDGCEIITDYGLVRSGDVDSGKESEVLERLEQRGLRPAILYADGGYPSGDGFLSAEAAGTKLYAPVSGGRLPDDAILRDAFRFDEDSGFALACPAGHAPLRHAVRSVAGSNESALHAYFDGALCRACPMRGRCAVRPPNNGRSGHHHLDIRPGLRARDRVLAEQRDAAWWDRYAIRAGIEATMSELKRGHGVGRLRVRRLARVALAVSCKVAACNIKRWLRAVAARTQGGAGADKPTAPHGTPRPFHPLGALHRRTRPRARLRAARR